ncbi:MAG: MBL fold metallo-hydrolase [Desulfocapsaceae bacterium]|nr:MBL fold metallo-hydrolase [Desulfocapsaceae bacterium]
MQFSILGSGSKGNSVYVESKDTAILIDAGFSGKQLSNRLSAIGKDISRVKGIFLTHEHNDHISGAGVVSRRSRIPVFANDGTFSGADQKLGKLHKRGTFTTGEATAFQDLEVRSFRTLHDTNDPVGFVISDGEHSLGYCTDTGKVTHLMAARLRGCDALILEFNHDPEMLKNGPYPLALQQRVRSSHGHLANDDAAAFLAGLLEEQLRYVVLAHLSEINNLPEIAHKAAHGVASASRCRLILSSQNTPTSLITLKKSLEA